MDYAVKCWWLLTRGNTIKDLHQYNAAAVERIVREGRFPPRLPPSMSFMQSRGDTHSYQFSLVKYTYVT